MSHIHIDPFSGISGDMMLGSLLDLGLELDQITERLKSLPIDEPYHLTAERTQRQSITGIDFRVHTEHHHHHDHDHDHDHGHSHSHDHSHHHHGKHRHYPDLMKLVEALEAEEHTKQRIAKVVTALAEAEASVHDISIDKVHFHEVGAIDSIVDMFGVCIGLEILKVQTLSCGPLPITRGYVKCDHGLMPVPAPATMRLMQGIATVGLDRKGELVTPTGAALARGLCESFGPPPAMNIEKVGYGAGDHDFPEAPNLLRLILGTKIASDKAGSHHAHGHSHDHDHDHTHDHSRDHSHDHEHHHA